MIRGDSLCPDSEIKAVAHSGLTEVAVSSLALSRSDAPDPFGAPGSAGCGSALQLTYVLPPLLG